MASKELSLVQFETAQHKLNTVYKKLSNEPQVQKELSMLVLQWGVIREKLKTLLTNEGLTVIAKKSMLLSEVKPKDKTMAQFTSAVSNFREGLSVWTDDVRLVLKTNQRFVEICRKKKRERDDDIKLVCIHISKSRGMISSIESDIQSCNDDAIGYENDAWQFERSAKGSRQRSKLHAKLAIFGSGICILTGTLLAPFTGGTGLALALFGAGMNTAFNGTAAIVNAKSASSSKHDANMKRKEAEDLRQKIIDQERVIVNKELELSKLRLHERELETTIEMICDVEDMIITLVEDVEARLVNVQDVESILQKITLSGRALRIIISAFGGERMPGCFSKVFGLRAKRLKTNEEILKLNIQAKWDHIEKIILPNREESNTQRYPQLL